MSLTPYHTQYFAYELTKRCASSNLEKFAGTFAGAKVDLNPHQVEAALFAFESPLSKGALLADEVGLGKTIEAGLVIAQKWAERQRYILVITPASLRKQWLQELSEKFFLPGKILESKSFKAEVKDGVDNPFKDNTKIVFCSYQFAKSKEMEVRSILWDLVVIDEAHRLRNVYKSSNVIAKTLRRSLEGRQKLLLTATPLQNSLLELFGLVSFIDNRAFGSLSSFREQFTGMSQDYAFNTLKKRLKPFCYRTLRQHVTAYVRFTKRYPIVEEFTPTDDELRLYELVSDYLGRDNLQALPYSQRSLITLVLRKQLASSTFAIAGTLYKMAERLKQELSGQTDQAFTENLDADYEALSSTAEEWEEAESANEHSEVQQAAIQAEIVELEQYGQLATSIEHNAKGAALLKVLDKAFAETLKLGGAKKAIIFTESRRTQDYLLRLLGDSGWDEGLLLFNGTNNDQRSKQIYAEWLNQHRGTDRVTGSRTADMRSALVDYFREQGNIMIATEAAAEGINLQFCSLIINYDLPWNPQRIEQRIGRCHRYGQKHDVVVVNFLNRKNAADQRVYQLLSEKFKLFEGVFGTSDEVLGAIESGVDFEKRIADIYQRCRKPDDIETAFDQLQAELSQEIDAEMQLTRKKLIENFDDEVREKLRVQEQHSKVVLGQFEKLLMKLTRHELQGYATFEADSRFRLAEAPFSAPTVPDAAIELGVYELPRKSEDAHAYRLGHPLADGLVERAKQRQLPRAEIYFDYEAHKGKITIVEPFLGKSGFLSVLVLTVVALDQSEDRFIFAAITDQGERMDVETVKRLFSLPGQIIHRDIQIDTSGLDDQIQEQRQAVMQEITERNAEFFQAEAEKLDAWAEDRKLVLERDIKDLDRQIKEAKRSATRALDLQAKLAGQKQVRELERQRNQKRRSLFEAQDEVDAKRDELIAQIESKLEQSSELKQLFTIRWQL